MKKLIPLILVLILISCGARSKYNKFAEQAVRDEYNPILEKAWEEEEIQNEIEEDTKQQTGEIYSQIDSKHLVGSNPGEKNSYTSNEEYTRNLGEKIRKDALNTTNKYGNLQPYTYNGDIKSVNFKLYADDPAYIILGFSPYRNNAALYRDYYKIRKDSWTTLWGLLNQ